MRAEDVDFTKSVPLVIPVFDYDADLRDRVFTQMILFTPTKLSPAMEKITKKLQTGYAFMAYDTVLNKQEITKFESEMDELYGPAWSKFGFHKTSKAKLVEDKETRVVFSPFRITKYMTWINLLIFLEEFLLSKIEYLTLSDVLTGEQLLLDGNPNFDEAYFKSRDEKYNLPLYSVNINKFPPTNLFQPIVTSSRLIIRCDNYKNLLDNFIYDEYATGTTTATEIYQQHIRVLLPLLNQNAKFGTARRARNERRSAFPEYYNYRHNTEAGKRIMNNDVHINELITLNNIKLITFRYELIPQISELYQRNKTTPERIFDSVKTSETFPVSIISNRRGGTYSAKIFKQQKIKFNALIDSGQISALDLTNVVTFYSTVIPEIEKFVVSVSDESVLQLTIYNRRNVIITPQTLDRIFALINSEIVSQIWNSREDIYPLYVDEIVHPVLDIKNIVMFTAHVNTAFETNLREFKKMRVDVSRAIAGVFGSVLTTDILQLQDGYANSKLIIKYGTTISIYIKRFIDMRVYNILINLVLKAIGAWYIKTKRINKGNARMSNIKLLKAADPGRFGFEPTSVIDRYSTRVQKTKQPTPMSKKQADAEGYEPHRRVELESMSIPGRKTTYVCKSDKFQHIGFVKTIRLKYGICAPGCFRTDQSTKKSTRTIYHDCLSGKDGSPSTDGTTIQSAYYVGKYESQITTGKYYSLPWEFGKRLGEDQANTQTVVNKGIKIHLIYGGEPNGLVKLINSLLKVDFMKDAAELFSKDPTAFIGLIESFGDKFILPENYIDFLRGEGRGEPISHAHLAPLISLLYPDVGFFIILPHKDRHLVDFMGLGKTERSEVYRKTANSKIFVLILKDTIYSPVVFVHNKQHTANLESDDRLVGMLRSFYNPDGSLQYNPQHSKTRVAFTELISSYSGPHALAITGETNEAVQLQLDNAHITLYYILSSSNNDVLNKPKDVIELFDTLGINIVIAYKNTKRQLTHILGDYMVIAPIKPTPVAKYSGKFEIILYSPLNLTTDPPTYPKQLVETAYERHLEHLALQALNIYLRKQKDARIRNEILRLIKKSKIDSLESIPELTPRDAMLIRDIHANRKSEFKKYFDNIQFEFEVDRIKSKYTNKTGFKHRINKLVDQLVVVRRHKADINPQAANCYIDPKASICYRGKLVTSTRGKKRINVLFFAIFSNNDFLREVILRAAIPNKVAFTPTADEMIKTLTLN